ncbi:MAG TPA: CRTAC1 family protein, partial [Chthonomonadales bacterium]|nr:CRTAC1 family protein [Chthonomonadales bacterium]
KSATYMQPLKLFRSNAGSSFQDVSAAAGTAFAQQIMGRGLAVGDFDNDGKQDVLVVNSEGSPMLLHNDTQVSGHWLSITLQGVRCNRDGIGSLITATAGKLHLLSRCGTDGSYMSASDRRVHFGLGAASKADIKVSWPDGHVDKYNGVAADRVVTIREGSASV